MTPGTRFAFTAYQPWASALVLPNGKGVENRPKRPPKKVMGQLVAIHAGRQYDQRGDEWIRRTFPGLLPPAGWLPHGAIVGVAWLKGWIDRPEELPEAQRPWFFGPIGWVLENAIQLPDPVSCHGQQGFWPVPEHVLAVVRAQLQRVAVPAPVTDPTGGA